MHRFSRLLVTSLALTACGTGAVVAPPHATPSFLPLRALRLYETGVGYFERSGETTSATTLPVPAGHLDDALKSLVIIRGGGQARVAGLSFPTSVSRGMARALSGLPRSDDTPLTYRDLLTSLKAAEVELTLAHGSMRGRIVEVTGDGEPRKEEPETKAGASPNRRSRSTLTLLVLTDKGEMQQVPVEEVLRVRPLDPDFAQRLGTTLDALSPRSAQTDRNLRLIGELSGPVTFGYVTETATWRASYRLVQNADGQGALQGWALLHNDTEESWSGIKLELVNGRPDAFLFPLAAPRYGRRELVHPTNGLSTVPQLLQQTSDSIWGEDPDNDSDGSGGLGVAGLGAGQGFGSGEGHLWSAHKRRGAAAASDLLEVGNLAQTATATGVESGALFRYVLGQPLFLDAHSSALVPFIDTPLKSEFASVTSEEDPGNVRAFTLFVNATGQTLPAGPISFFSGGGFAGESALPRMKPGERRFVTFAADLDVTVHIEPSKPEEETQRVVWADDLLEEHFFRTVERRIDLTTRSASPRDLYLSLDINANAKLTGADGSDFDKDAGRPLAIFHLTSPGETRRVVTTVEGLERKLQLQEVTGRDLLRMASAKGISATERTTLAEAAARMLEHEKSQKAHHDLKGQIDRMGQDLERLRTDLKAASGDKGAAADAGPIVKRILAAEDRLDLAQHKLDALAEEARTRKDAARDVLARLAPQVEAKAKPLSP